MDTQKALRLLFILCIFLCVKLHIYSQQLNYDKEVEILLSKMTLNEKIGQMNQLNFYEMNDELLEKVKKGDTGSLLNTTDPRTVNRLQKAAMESRLGIPLLIARDVIHGYKTIFPIPLGQAASFDPQIAETGARVAAVEASENGIRWTFAPMIDIARDARWGRIAESPGEDPYLTAIMGEAMVKGFQGADLSDPTSMAACAKHFVGYGASEGGRDYNSTSITSHALKNIYLPPFQKSIDTGVATVMTSFNDNDGIPSSGNKNLLKNILRGEMGFNGLIVSDWNSVGEMITHGFAADGKDAAMISANAGLDMEMNTELYIKHLKQLVEEGKVLETDIDNSVRYILKLKYRLGLFSNPYIEVNKPTTIYSEKHLQAAKDAALKSAVLLKNENILPLKETQKIAIIGPMADAPHDQLGTWIFDGEASHTVTPIGALKSNKDYKNLKVIYEPILRSTTDTDTSNFSKIQEIVKKTDVAVVFLGEESRLSGEAHSLSNINLIGVQSELLKEVKKAGKPVVLVIMAGRPLTIERDLPYADAILYNFHPGTMGGPAVLDLLFGKANPSGKLPVTFVREVGQIPLYYNHNNTGRPAPDNAKTLYTDETNAKQTSVGDVSFYLDSGKEPLYPFGYGLSYSKFEYSDLTLSSNVIGMNDTLTMSVTLENTSSIEGTEVVQLYIRDLVGSIIRPVKELKGFQRVNLKARESKTVRFTLSAEDLAFYGIDMTKKAEPGYFNVWVGGSSKAELGDTFLLE